MPYPFTRVFALALCAASWIGSSPTRAADASKSYPTRPIRLIVPQSPGAANDTISRIVAAKMGEALGQQFVIDNRAGAGGVIAAEIAARAAPDGYTLFATGTSPQVIAPQIIKNLKYHPTQDFAPISLFAVTHNVLVVNPKLPVTSVRELVAYGRANPGKLNVANAGPGTQSHLAGVALFMALGIDVIQVPYKGGGPAVAAVIAGESQVAMPPAPAVMSHVRSGRLRALGSSGAKRSPGTPELATLIESGVPGFVFTGWFGLLAPKGTPKPIISRLHETLVKAVNDLATSKQMGNAGGDPETNSPAEFSRFMDEEWKRFGAAIKAANLKSE